MPGSALGIARSRTASAIIAAVVIVAVTLAVIFANTIAARRPARLDMTFSGAHRLSPRSTALVDQLTGQYEIILAINPRNEDRRVLDAVRDVLDAYARSSPAVGFTEIDLGSGAGVGQAETLLERLAAERRADLDERADLVESALTTLEDAAPAFESIGAGLERVRGSIPELDANRAYFEQRAAIARVTARELGELSGSIRTELESGSSLGGVVDTNRLLDPMREAAAALGAQLRTLASDVRAFVDAPGVSRPARDAAAPLVRQIESFRDRVAVASDRLGRARPIGLISAARALETGQTLLVIGPPDEGVTAVDLESLLPSAELLERAELSPGAIAGERAETLVSTAIASLARPDRPIVVLVHGEATTGLIASAVMAELRRGIEAGGMDLLEWAAAAGEPDPDRSEIDPAGARPVVYVTLAPDSTAGSGGDPENTGAARAERLGAAIERLIAEGKPVLVSANPSVFPTYGDADPVTAPLEAFGVRALTGTPLLAIAAGARVATETQIVPGEGDSHPIAASVRDLTVLLPWAVPVETDPVEGVKTNVIVRVVDAPGAWAESSWMGYWRTPRDRRELIPDPPAFDQGVDERRDWWDVAVAVERAGTGSGRARAVFVGSNGWMLDPIAARRSQVIQGRAPLAFPGNIELLESSVLWLAGQDELIAPSSSGREVAVVRNIGRGRDVIRWVLIVGLPGLILVGGVAHRVFRG